MYSSFVKKIFPKSLLWSGEVSFHGGRRLLYTGSTKASSFSLQLDDSHWNSENKDSKGYGSSEMLGEVC